MTGRIGILTEDPNLAAEIEGAIDFAKPAVFSKAEDVKDTDVLILDADTTGIACLSALKDDHFVIVVTEQRGTRYLIESMTFGAFDCIFRPFDDSGLGDSIKRALGISAELDESLTNFHVTAEGASSVTCAIVGDSPMLQDVCKLIGQVGRVDVPVLITGESGTGKELVAESVWKVSTRWEKPFVVLNCAAIPEALLEAELFGYEKGAFTGASSARTGKFEEADGGTIFLDELGDMPLSLQAKVLRVLQSGTFHRLGSNKEISVDVRIISATNQNLDKMVKEGKFREDLFFRINVVRIHLPALRERRQDIPLLYECFTKRHSSQIGKEIKGVSSKFQKMLIEHDWPGNVRELENVIRKAIAFTKTPYLTSYDLDLGPRIQSLEPSSGSVSYQDALRSSVKNLLGSDGGEDVYGKIVKEAEVILLEEALQASGWNRSQAARVLGINRLTLRRKLEEYGIGGDQAADGD